MQKEEILKLSQEINFSDLEKARKELEKKYEISYGRYEAHELKKALSEKNPVIIKEHFLVGYDPDGQFVDINDEKVPVEKMVKAIIVEDIKEVQTEATESRDPFIIYGKNEWEDSVDGFAAVFNKLHVGDVFLPPHSAIVNFLKPDGDVKKKKIVSVLEGVNINIYDKSNYIDNAIHEIGHLFWRDCLNYDEKESFKEMFKLLKPSAIYEFTWERETEEEVFCTVYKWYVKSILLNRAFYNILEHEEPKGLKLMQDAVSRIARDRQIADVWELNKTSIIDYFNPVFDKTTGHFLRKAGAFDRIKDVEIPSGLLKNIEYIKDGIEYIDMEKAGVLPVKGNKIYWEKIKNG